MTIGPATPGDLPGIRNLHLSNWREAYRGLVPDAALEGEAARYLAKRWAPEALARDMVFIGSEGPALRGFIAVRLEAAGHVYVDNLHVAPAARGNGLSRALMAEAGRLAGPRPVRLTVLDGNRAARAVYARWSGAEGPAFAAEFLGVTVLDRQVDWPSGEALLQALAVAPA
jgi:ribosomal protein S18 acetylase RimI-like enzyme